MPDPVGFEVVQAYRNLPTRSRAAARLRVARQLGWPVQTVVHLPSDAQILDESPLTVTSIAQVRLAESVPELAFLEAASSLGRAEVDAALSVLRARQS